MRQFKKEIQKLIEYGVQIQNPKLRTNKGSDLQGKTLVIKGTLPLDRNKIKELAENADIKVSSNISKKTSFLLAGESPGDKLKKAQILNTKILRWNDFLKLIKYDQ